MYKPSLQVGQSKQENELSLKAGLENSFVFLFPNSTQCVEEKFTSIVQSVQLEPRNFLSFQFKDFLNDLRVQLAIISRALEPSNESLVQ